MNKVCTISFKRKINRLNLKKHLPPHKFNCRFAVGEGEGKAGRTGGIFSQITC